MAVTGPESNNVSKMFKWKSPDVNRGGILEICRLCLEEHNNLCKAKNLESFLFFVLPDLDLSLSENPLICFQCIQQLTDSYIFKTRCIYNQDQILKLQHLFQRPVYLQEVVQGIDFHKENKQTSEVVHNNLKILLGKTFGNIKSSEKSEILLNENEVGENAIEYCCEEEVVEIKKEFCYSGLLNGQSNENEKFAQKQILIGHSKFMDTEEVEINYIEEDLEELPSTKCKRDVEIVNEYSDLMEVTKVEYIEEETEKAQIKKRQSLSTKRKRLSKLPSLVLKKPKPTLEKPFQCNFCYKLFAQKINCDSHFLHKHKDVPNIETYISSKIHCCHYCAYRTINSYSLSSHLFTRHDNKHSGIKFMECYTCGYTTHNKGNLSIHMRRHGNLRPFKCKLCKKRFSQKINLNYHYLAMHSHEENIELLITNKLYVCNICSFKSLDKKKYAIHVIKRHRVDVS